MAIAFNQLLNLSENQLEEIKEILYNHCLICCESTTYGDYPIDVDWENEQTEAEANLAYFGVANKNDAFEKSKNNPSIVLETPSISIKDNGEISIWFYPQWGDCEIKIVEGKVH